MFGAPTITVPATVTVDPQIVVADGNNAAAITITLLDNNGNPKSGRDVSVTSSRQATMTTETIVQPGATDSSGQTTATISSTTPGVTTIYARDVQDDVTLAQQLYPG